MAKKKAKKKTPLQKKFEQAKKRIDKILRELNVEDRVITPTKLSTKYVEKLSSITKKELKQYYSGQSLGRRNRTISSKISTQKFNQSNIATHSKKQTKKKSQLEPTKIKVRLDGTELIDIETNEVYEILDEYELGMIDIEKLDSYLEMYYPKYEIVNLEDVLNSYMDYGRMAYDRFMTAVDKVTTSNFLRNLANDLISKMGIDNFGYILAEMPQDFWDALDVVLLYFSGEDEETEMSKDEIKINFDKVSHYLNEAYYNYQLKHNE